MISGQDGQFATITNNTASGGKANRAVSEARPGIPIATQ
jgi:hypothetical protein